MICCNTDGLGFKRAIREEFSTELTDLRVLLCGAGGGAGRAIAHQCVRENCRRLVLANRDFAKSKMLAAQLRVEAIEWSRLDTLGEIDLVINATPFPLAENCPARFFYDLNYTSKLAVPNHANGLSMLLHQGALAFEKWFERDAPIAAMRAAL